MLLSFELTLVKLKIIYLDIINVMNIRHAIAAVPLAPFLILKSRQDFNCHWLNTQNRKALKLRIFRRFYCNTVVQWKKQMIQSLDSRDDGIGLKKSTSGCIASDSLVLLLCVSRYGAQSPRYASFQNSTLVKKCFFIDNFFWMLL